MHSLRIARAENDILMDEDGRRYIDLFSAHGTTWLGHGNRAIAAYIAKQLERVWITGGLETAVFVEAITMVEGFFPPTHGLAALYSTGMEAAEFAMRVARAVTGKTGVVGFENSMHGKSLATSYLGWDNQDGMRLPDLHRLPFVQRCPEEEILRRLEEVLRRHPVSAVFLEPVQGCGGGHMASKRFYGEVSRRCREGNVLLVVDEILTGFYRTGTPFCFSELGLVPDIVLIGKAMGNGFPVSGVVVERRHVIRKEMLPGSTYAGNPLAAAAVLGTLRQLRGMDLPAKVAQIEATVLGALRCLQEIGVALRGKGALWIIEVPPGLNVERVVVSLYKAGVCVGYTGRQIRILPAATIGMDNLARACSIIATELLRERHG
ncbi:MAG TPA: aminotransferase class III-fold pyridoxal phosphate-dependent enzyme [Candidatus Methylomirabilis sp.]|nr:aminotransferase class III-fold pyridoxal phosphate-dependent enzyme [Candidatus Methylomirabilis sp.]